MNSTAGSRQIFKRVEKWQIHTGLSFSSVESAALHGRCAPRCQSILNVALQKREEYYEILLVRSAFSSRQVGHPEPARMAQIERYGLLTCTFGPCVRVYKD